MKNIVLWCLAILSVVGRAQGQGSKYTKIKVKDGNMKPANPYDKVDSALGFPQAGSVPNKVPQYLPAITLSPEEITLALPQRPQSCNSFSEETITTYSSQVLCVCKAGFEGTSPNCTMGPKLWDACYNNNPCGYNSDCEMDAQNQRQCSCSIGYFGCPPNCKSSYKRESICDNCGPNSECVTDNYERTRCKCAAGFMGSPPNCTAGPTLLKSCDPYPCGPNSCCNKKDGKPICSCLPGFQGEAPNCKPEPELWKICVSRGNPCLENEICQVGNKGPKCLPCPGQLRDVAPYCLTLKEYIFDIYQ